ncbi:uncharacterized protein HKW66_Vig0127620 [Vigna angularis]|uniref:Transposase, Ptta/En/Spm, plant n=1 Tax=Phaseolus angularis TaxID=3914 RepID=A0A8T0K2X4_PHAAN|nr:uncharacterized protein LOC108338603 [Vigna angularis]KAG2391477.1 uncharacterized protein HKW66_Vig0127620 [Vigna angularis]
MKKKKTKKMKTKKMIVKNNETQHHTPAPNTWSLIVNHPLAPQSAAPEVQSSPSLSTPQRRTYKLKLPPTSQSLCTPGSIQPPNATVVQSADQVFSFGQPPNEAVQSPVEVDQQENSHVQDEHEQDENQDILLEVQQERPPTYKRSWLVDVIDDQCKRTTKHLKTNDVWNLPQNERIIVHWNEEYQPIGDGGALLNRFLGSIARNFKAFPICYSTWKKIPKDYKEDTIHNIIQTKFAVNSDIQIKYILKALNHKWRDWRQELWQQRDDGTRTRDELIAMAPKGIDRDHWTSFVDYRLDERTKEIALKNKHNRTKQTLAHTGGSKSIARKREEMERECGHKVSRGEVWIATHKKANRAFVSDEAREIGEKIEAYESITWSQSKIISTSDSLAHALGMQEHCGRVRGLGLGPCPSKVFGVNARSHSGLQTQVSSLTSQVNEMTSQVNEMKEMIAFMLQNYEGQLPSKFATFQPSVSDQESVPNNECNGDEEN